MATDINELPLVSVVIPVYNASPFIHESVRSILQQTYRHLEVIIVDDGSTDDSAEKIRQLDDHRIRFIENGQNLGLIATLNKAIGLCTGEFIARLDADDIALPDRITIQVRQMQENPSLMLLGSGYMTLGGDKNRTVILARTKGSIQANMLFNSCFAHPSVMLRKEVFRRREVPFHPDFPHAEDYELWAWIISGYDAENLAEPLIFYRLHDGQVSRRKSSEQRFSAQKVRIRLLQELDVPFLTDDFEFHRQLAESEMEMSEKNYTRAVAHIHTIILAAAQKKHIDFPNFQRYMQEYVADMARYMRLHGYSILRSSALFRTMPALLRIKTLLKCSLWT